MIWKKSELDQHFQLKKFGFSGNWHKPMQKYGVQQRNLKRNTFAAKCEPISAKIWEQWEIKLEIVKLRYFLNLPMVLTLGKKLLHLHLEMCGKLNKTNFVLEVVRVWRL